MTKKLQTKEERQTEEKKRIQLGLLVSHIEMTKRTANSQEPRPCKSPEPRRRVTYTQEQKDETMKLVKQGVSISEISRQTGVHISSIKMWRMNYKIDKEMNG
jgi:transposase-like protein